MFPGPHQQGDDIGFTHVGSFTSRTKVLPVCHLSFLFIVLISYSHLHCASDISFSVLLVTFWLAIPSLVATLHNIASHSPSHFGFSEYSARPHFSVISLPECHSETCVSVPIDAGSSTVRVLDWLVFRKSSWALSKA